MPYGTYTLAQATTDLSQQLYDAGQQFWQLSTGELQAYLVEALQTWNAITSYWRSEFVFSLQSGVWWYDLALSPGTVRPYTATDQQLIKMIELHLLEPVTDTYPLVWTGTRQFGLSNLIKSLQVKTDETLSSTGCTIRRTLVNAGPVIRTFLDDSSIDIRRLAWLPVSDFANIPLYSDDDWGKEAFDPGYTTAPQQPPTTFRQTTQPQLAFDVDYIPPVSGDYEVLTTNAGPTLNTDAPSLLPVPTDWAWVIKWGALEDLLSLESNAKDGMRAAYASKRFTDGLKMMAQTPALLAARINNIPIGVDAVRNADNFRPLWQNEASSAPDSCYVAGLNLIAVSPSPDSGPYSFTASVVMNAPIPSNPGDFMQIGRDDYDAILDYAQHLAAFKMGGQEFLATLPLLEGFFRRATLYNSKLSVLGQFQPTQYEVSQLQAERNPVYGKEVPV